jgi:hypothetical protein
MGIGWWYATVITANARCGAGESPAGQRQAQRRRDRGPSPVLLGDPAGVGAEVFAAGRRAAAAVLAWPVQQRFRPGVGAASAIEVTTL